MNAPAPQPFLATLQAEREATARFVDLLRREQRALSSGATDEIDALTPQKASLAEELAHYGRARRSHLIGLGLPPDAHGMRSWAASHAQAGHVSAVWESLYALAGQARALNETNGVLIEMQLQTCERSLAALNDAAGRTTLYGPRGHAIAVQDAGSRTALRA